MEDDDETVMEGMRQHGPGPESVSDGVENALKTPIDMVENAKQTNPQHEEDVSDDNNVIRDPDYTPSRAESSVLKHEDSLTMVASSLEQEHVDLNSAKSITPGKQTGDPTVHDLRALQFSSEGKVHFKLFFSEEVWEDLPQRIQLSDGARTKDEHSTEALVRPVHVRVRVGCARSDLGLDAVNTLQPAGKGTRWADGQGHRDAPQQLQRRHACITYSREMGKKEELQTQVSPAMGGSDSSCDTEVPSMRVLGSRACRPASVINVCTFQVACNQDRACGKGFSCDRHFGLCVPLRQEGGYCRRDAQCVRGLGCMFGRCIRRIPEGQEGARCKVDKDCEASMCCARHHGERVCKQRLALGESCFVPDGGLAFSINQICPCQEGLLCRGNGQPKKRGMEFVYYPELNNWTCQEEAGYTAILIYVIRMPTVCGYGVDFYFEMFVTPKTVTMSTAMNFGTKSFKPSPPDKGSFPLDHFGECKSFKEKFMRCLRDNKFDNALCRLQSKEYLECRMDKQLMTKEPLEKLGFRDLMDQPKEDSKEPKI
ncbi:hypothetical protein P4O66_010759 [Electrophorus voltai]|nr:hypothetical protein P4O66_010759 [Electrophorus voltai]